MGRMRFVLIGTVYNAMSNEQPTGVCLSVSGCGFDGARNSGAKRRNCRRIMFGI